MRAASGDIIIGTLHKTCEVGFGKGCAACCDWFEHGDCAGIAGFNDCAGECTGIAGFDACACSQGRPKVC